MRKEFLHQKSLSQIKQLSFEDGLWPCGGPVCAGEVGVFVHEEEDGVSNFNECMMWKSTKCKYVIWKG